MLLDGCLGHMRRAAHLVGASDGALARMGAAWQPADQPEHDRTVAMLHDALGTEELERLLAEGRAMSLDQAVGYALADAAPVSA